ncbi:helix-turn-helix domain-containing protein, partial [Aeromicrobium sp. REDSEA-S32_B7]
MPPAAPDQLRRANTALVLRTLRDHGPGSRSALARRTGLAKATVGAIVGELAEHAVVVEGEASSQGRGRP